MFMKQAELFWGLGHDFVKAVMDKAKKRSFETGHVLFSEGDAAIHFYTLISGRVKLTVGEARRSVFTVSRAGESFGWSSLVGRDAYSASAHCAESTTVMEIDCEDFWKICTEKPEDGMVFMKRLAALLGQRLVLSYKAGSAATETGAQPSFGTGQVLEPATEE